MTIILKQIFGISKIQMEIIYNAFNFFKTNGFVNLHHLIEMSQDIDMQDLYYFYDKEKDNKEIIDFMNHYQKEYGLKTIFDSSMANNVNETIYKVGTISTGECIICYDDNKVGFKTPCNHFMCMECCGKLFQDDTTINKCPYCREKVVLYRMNEIIKLFKNDEEIQVDNQDQFVPNFTNSFIRGRLIYDDELELAPIVINYDELSIPFVPDIFTPSQRPSLIEHYMNRNGFISPPNERLNVQNADLPDFIFPIHDVTDPYTIRTRLRERRVYTNMMGRRTDYPTRSQFFNSSIQLDERQQESRPEISNNPPRGNLPRPNIIPRRNSSNTNTRHLRPDNRRQNSRSEIKNNNTIRNIPRNGRR